MDIYSTVTMDRCWICDSLPTVSQRFVNGLEIEVKNSAIFLKLMKFGDIVLSEYSVFDRYTYIDTRDTEGARVAVCPIEFKTFPRARKLWDTS